MMHRIIIDTDIGGDIDDAFALCLAMQSPELELMAVTTVYQATDKKAMLARRLLDAGGFGRVPVYAGERMPMTPGTLYGKEVDYCQVPLQYRPEYETIEGWKDGAVNFIIETLEQKENGNVTLIAIGPLTNLGKVFALRPELAKKVCEIVVMGGAYYTNWCEYNFAADPWAADIVLNCGAPVRVCGTDVTFSCTVPSDLIAGMRRSREKAVVMLCEMLDLWGHGTVTLHDPLALWTVFDPSVVEYEDKAVRVEYQARYANGTCVVMNNFNWNLESGRIQTAKQVDAERFVTLCMDRIIHFAPRNR